MPVHPRACGERGHRLRDLIPGEGSSPRVRGTEPRSQQDLIDYRFIPARAGNGTY